MKKQKYLVLSIVIVASLLLISLTSTVIAKPLGATAPDLGNATNFSALAADTATSATTTTIERNLGVSPGLASTGNWVVGGSEYYGPATLAADAQASALAAYGNLMGQGSIGTWGSETNLAPGAWSTAGDQTFSGSLTLDGDYADVWVFQIGRDFTFSGVVTLTGNAQPCHVFWAVARSTVIASGSSFVGTLISMEDITLVDGANVQGRVLSYNGALTTDNNTINVPPCEAAPADDDADAVSPSVDSLPSTGGAPIQAEPIPWYVFVAGGFGTFALAALGLIVIRRGN